MLAPPRQDIRALKTSQPSLTAKQLHERLGAKHGATLTLVKRCASAVHKKQAALASPAAP